MDSLALRKRMLPPSTKMAAYAVSLRPWPLSNTLLSFILASLLTGMAPIPKTAGLIKLGKQVISRTAGSCLTTEPGAGKVGYQLCSKWFLPQGHGPVHLSLEAQPPGPLAS
ncbi:tetratricopeptide repeat protein 31 isoform X6 [Dama dama]|uniref:tetratricopeptide repeat protein 31 isoform X6 n=1 Tax=Dama dama TaxID=30532 RepID=UPI002A372197|nr:tetratricopeptide repeat protein 31 isoform X6 [Dama dama]